MDDKKKNKDNVSTKSLLIAIVLVGAIVSGLYFVPWATLFPPAATPTPAAKATSTFTLIDYRTGEDVTAWVEISVYTPNPDDLPFEDNDAQTLANFDEEESSEDAEDVAIDLRDHAVFWLEIDPDFESDYGGYNGVYNVIASRDFRKGFGGVNYDYTVYVYHAPSNVSVAMLTKGAMGVTNLGDARPYNNTFFPDASSMIRGTDGTYQVTLEMPYQSTNAYHAGVSGGDEWDMDDEEEAEIQADADLHSYDIDYDLLWLQDQSNHRTIAPYYDLTDDNEDDFDEDLEQLTNAFAIEFTFNATVSLVDAAATQVNLTVMDRDSNEVPVDVVYSATNIFIIFHEPITCYNHMYNFDIQLAFGTDIVLSTVETCRLEVPEDDDNLGTATLLNTMLLTNYA